jgi:broad specificity phosphatase PhoE
MAKVFYIIRHGESQSNAGEKTEHPATINLTQTGRDQAQAKADGFPQTPDLIVTTPFIRTKQTAEPFIEKFPGVKVEEWEMQEFTFLSKDKYNGWTHHERRPFLEAYWKNADPNYKDDASAESFAEFISRVRRVIKKMGEAEGDVTIAFGHGYTMSGILFVLGGHAEEVNANTMKNFWDFYLKLIPGNLETMEFKIDSGEVSYVPRARPQTPAKKPGAPKIND